MILAMETRQPLGTGVAPVVAGVDTVVKAQSIPQTLPLAVDGAVVVAEVVMLSLQGGATPIARCISGSRDLLLTKQPGMVMPQDTKARHTPIIQEPDRWDGLIQPRGFPRQAVKTFGTLIHVPG